MRRSCARAGSSVSFLYLLFCWFIFASCGDDSSSAPRRITPQILSENRPLIYSFGTTECLSPFDSLPMEGDFTTSFFQNSTNQTNLTLSLERFNNSNPIRSVDSKVNQVVIDYKILVRDGLVEETQGKQIFLCESQKTYPEDSIEDIALSTMPLLATMFEQVEEAGQTLPPVDLILHPQISLQETDETANPPVIRELFFVDNAAYAVEGGTAGTGAILIYPQSAETAGNPNAIFGGLPLWKIPSVLAHEFGHHIFFHQYEKQISSGFRSRVHSSFSNRLSHRDNDVRSNPYLQSKACYGHNFKEGHAFFSESEDLKKLIAAVDEGYSDLFAHFIAKGFWGDAWDMQESLFLGISCLEDSRDVTIDSFIDGRKKVFDEQAAFELFNSNLISTCSRPAYSSFYTLGAQFAHTVFKIMEQTEWSDQAILKTLVEWPKELLALTADIEALIESDNLNGAYERILRSFIEKIADAYTAKKMPEAICDQVDESLPLFSSSLVIKVTEDSEVSCQLRSLI